MTHFATHNPNQSGFDHPVNKSDYRYPTNDLGRPREIDRLQRAHLVAATYPHTHPPENDTTQGQPPPFATAISRCRTLLPPMTPPGGWVFQVASQTSRGPGRRVCHDRVDVHTAGVMSESAPGTIVAAPEEVIECTVACIDGVGGARGGAAAAAIVSEELRIAAAQRWSAGASERPLELATALHAANTRMLVAGARRPDIAGLAAAVSCATIVGRVLVTAHVGHGSILVGRAGTLEVVTRKHTVEAEVAGNGGRIRLARHLGKQLTRAVGLGAVLDIDFQVCDLARGDWVIVCSNGLADPLPEGAIARVLAQEIEPARVCGRLTTMAIAHGGTDDASLAVLRVA